MTCPSCMQWCATSEAQLANRVGNIGSSPDVRMHPCPNCGGTDWGTSREMIRGAPQGWRTLEFWQKWMPAFNFGLALTCGGSVFFSGPTWAGAVNAFIAGANLASGLHSIILRRSSRINDEMLETLNAMHELNGQLIANKVEMIINGEDNAPIAPDRLH